MSIIRVRKNANYFTASNEPFNDKSLSWEARGLMGYLLTKPDHWEARTVDIENQGPAGNRKVRRMLAELRRAGYMNRIRITREDHTFDWITEVFESPSQNPNKNASGSFCTSAKSTSAKQPHIVSTEDSIYIDPVFSVLEQLRGGLNTETTRYVDAWKEKHTEEWILKAVAIAKEKGAGVKYVDSILIGWEANGYPKSRAEKVEERRDKPAAVPAAPVKKPLIKPEMIRK